MKIFRVIVLLLVVVLLGACGGDTATTTETSDPGATEVQATTTTTVGTTTTGAPTEADEDTTRALLLVMADVLMLTESDLPYFSENPQAAKDEVEAKLITLKGISGPESDSDFQTVKEAVAQAGNYMVEACEAMTIWQTEKDISAFNDALEVQFAAQDSIYARETPLNALMARLGLEGKDLPDVAD